jgi:hypothetical protein
MTFYLNVWNGPRSKRTDRIRPEFNGNHRIMEAVFQSGISSDFSGDFRLNSKLFRWEKGRKSLEKSEDIPARNTASMIR